MLKNQTPDLIILLSINSKERITVLSELQSLRLPIINFSSENSMEHQFIIPDPRDSQTIHFYMEIIRSLLLRSQQLQIAFQPAPEETESEEKDFYAQIPKLIRRYQKQLTEATSSTL